MVEADLMRPALPVVLIVDEVRLENEEMVTVYLSRPDAGEAAARGLDLGAFRPGHFFMIWAPGLDEKPYVISYLEPARLGITVQKRGPFSTHLFELKAGDKLGLRGPYGRPFWNLEDYADSERVALFGGGCGMATMALLHKCLPKATVVQGSRTASTVLFPDRFEKHVLFTDDGSAGRLGYPTLWLEEQVEAGLVEMVYTCGPEQMMFALAGICSRHGVGCQVSMERYMKCGIGVCGQCDCDGRLVCKDGPTFGLDDLAAMPSFGHARRDKTGRRHEIAPADQCPSGPHQRRRS